MNNQVVAEEFLEKVLNKIAQEKLTITEYRDEECLWFIEKRIKVGIGNGTEVSITEYQKKILE